MFKKAKPPPFDFTNIPFALPARELDLNSFMEREKWGHHVVGYTGAQLAESCRISTKDDGDLHSLHNVVVRYVKRIQPEIAKQAGFGQQKLLAQVGPSDSLAGFNPVTDETCDNYGRMLWRLVFNLLRQLEGTGGEYVYPLNAEQTSKLKMLASVAGKNVEPANLEAIAHRAINSLFSHIKENNADGKYFSAISCFTVISSFENDMHLRRASTLTSQINSLIYCNRTSQLHQIRVLLNGDPTMTFEQAMDRVKIFLQDSKETPMAYLFNLHSILKVVATAEHCEQAAIWRDAAFTKLSYSGQLIEIAKFKDAYDAKVREYERIVNEEIFFGHPPPSELLPEDIDPAFCKTTHRIIRRVSVFSTTLRIPAASGWTFTRGGSSPFPNCANDSRTQTETN
ncbi:hypothetical protein B0H19DRAFT_537211 [Mycena capillaripes]|nr:hypothetical protein B0H19DRAFT_537211 [Mycena capillaripes]